MFFKHMSTLEIVVLVAVMLIVLLVVSAIRRVILVRKISRLNKIGNK